MCKENAQKIEVTPDDLRQAIEDEIESCFRWTEAEGFVLSEAPLVALGVLQRLEGLPQKQREGEGQVGWSRPSVTMVRTWSLYPPGSQEEQKTR